MSKCDYCRGKGEIVIPHGGEVTCYCCAGSGSQEAADAILKAYYDGVEDAAQMAEVEGADVKIIRRIRGIKDIEEG